MTRTIFVVALLALAACGGGPVAWTGTCQCLTAAGAKWACAIDDADAQRFPPEHSAAVACEQSNSAPCGSCVCREGPLPQAATARPGN
jgi:hypothetical protein